MMSTRKFRDIVVCVCLGCLTTSLAVAQPVITTQPANDFVNASATSKFSVAASGTAPLTYQWLFDATAIASATSGSLSLANAQPTNSGFYSVIVSNASGAITSQVAELKVFRAAPHNLSGLQAASNGAVSLSFAGETTAPFGPYYDIYPLESSSNLLDWTPLALVQRTNAALDTLHFLDTNAAQFSQRFYRTPSNQLVTPDPQPTGPYPIGTFSMPLTNTNRANAKFMITIWYPAVAQAGVLPAKYVEPQVAGFYNLTGNGGGNFTTQVAAFFSHSLSNAPIAIDQSSYPVVLYDPAASGHRRENTDKAEDLASWGYVVVGLDTSGTAVSVFPDGTVVKGQAIGNATSDFVAAIEGRLLDLQFVMDELERWNAGDPRLGGHLDLDKIGVFGWSLGGAAAAQLCLRDPRCKAGIGMDGEYFETNLLTQSMRIPWLFFRSDDGPDQAWPPGVSDLSDGPDDRLAVYNDLITNAFFVKLASTVHPSFGDPSLIVDIASLENLVGAPVNGLFLSPARVSQIVRAYMLSFFNKFLKGEDDHLLDSYSRAYPEVMQFLSKSGVSSPPEYPSAAVTQGSDGNFYGTTAYGGANGNGTVFRVTPAGALTTLVLFNGTNGGHPVAGLAQGSDGNFYGTTAYGGANGNGTVFRVTSAGAFTTLISFNGTNGGRPVAGLTPGNDGNFYGTTCRGGADDIGTVFQITPAGTLTTLVSFGGANGGNPMGPLALGTNGNFYGTTSQGGNLGLNSGAGFGTVFEVTTAGVLSTLANFSGGNGANPVGGLVQGTNGNFYGTTAYGGNLNLNFGLGVGTVFKITPAGVLSTLVSFNGTHGSYGVGGLMQGGDGNFYGTTDAGGPGGCGMVFKLSPAGVTTTLASFNGADGSNPQGPLAEGSDGNFYGTAEYGGAGGSGTVFQMTPAGVLTTLVAFGAQTNAP